MDAWEIWNKGVQLSKAHLYIGPPEKVAACRKYTQQSSGSVILDRIADNADKDASFEDLFKGVLGPTGPRKKLEEELRSNIFERVRVKGLLAYGFAIPRRPEDTPIPIPLDLWNPYLQWAKDQARANGFQMDGIRITDPDWLDEANDQNTIKPAGRPSRKPQIIEAFETLDHEGKIDYSNPAKHCYPAIRNWVKLHYPEAENPDRGLGDKAIQLHVNPLFNAAKNRD